MGPISSAPHLWLMSSIWGTLAVYVLSGFPIISEGKVHLAPFLHLGWKQKSFQNLPECLSHVSPVTSACGSRARPPGSVLLECELCFSHSPALPVSWISGRISQGFLLAPRWSFQQHHCILPPLGFQFRSHVFHLKAIFSWSQVILFLFMKDALKYR